MSTVYRIEIDIRIDNRTRTKVIQTAREDYRKSPFAWTLEDGKPVEISAEEFVMSRRFVRRCQTSNPTGSVAGLRSRKSK
jgi:hypothetical protein